jgi:hypothetical protein
MTHGVLGLLFGAFALAPWSPLAAQTGRGSAGAALTSRVECSYLHRHSGAGTTEQHWLTALVLWRGQEGWRDRAVSSEAANRAYRMAERAAEDAGRHFVGGQSGGVVYSAAFDDDSLYVLGRGYPLPRGDSAFAIMVDRIDGVGGDPSIVATANITARLPAEFWTRHWMSGDTLFTILPREPQRFLLDALRRSPRLGQFLD